MPTVLPPRAAPQTEPAGVALCAAVVLTVVFLTGGMVLCVPRPSSATVDIGILAAEQGSAS